MLQEILILIALTFLPFLELRLAIPVGILATTFHLPYNITLTGFNLNPVLVLTICILANIVLGIIFYEFLFKFLHIFERFPKFYKIIDKFLTKSHKKVKPFVEKYGILGIALFIAVPLPGSGSYSGALGSFVLGISKKDFYIANAIGVTIAGILVTLLTLGFTFFG